MDEIFLGAYATEQDAIEAINQREEPKEELQILQDGDSEHPWRIKWIRPE